MDFLSCYCLVPEGRSDLFIVLCQRCGTPNVDLLASIFNTKLDWFVSRTRDPQAIVVNILVDTMGPVLSNKKINKSANSASSMSVIQDSSGRKASDSDRTSLAQKECFMPTS